MSYTTCDDKELQLESPPNPPPSSGPVAPIQNDGTSEQPDNPRGGSHTNSPITGNGVLDSD